MDEYALRFEIEENFLDEKSAGFQLESSQIRDGVALSHLGLILATATLYLVSSRVAYPHWLVEKRYRIETVFGQLVDRFHAKKVWARDAWHLTSRWWRKLLSHVIAVLFCQRIGLSPLRFSELLID